MPPRNTDGSLDRGPSRRTSSQIKKRGTAKAASKRLMSEMKNRRRKKKKNRSVGDKLMGGIRSIGSDLAMGLGFKDKTDDYLSRTADTTAIRRAIERGDKSKPALLLIHGFGASAYHWRYNVPELRSGSSTVSPAL